MKKTSLQYNNFIRQLSVMLKAGVPLIDALDSVQHSDQSNPLMSKTIQNVIEDVSGGLSLSKSLQHPKFSKFL